jgi:hypothetical protein
MVPSGSQVASGISVGVGVGGAVGGAVGGTVAGSSVGGMDVGGDVVGLAVGGGVQLRIPMARAAVARSSRNVFLLIFLFSFRKELFPNAITNGGA